MNHRPHRVCVVTGSRSEFGLLEPLMRAIKQGPGLELQVVATGMHLAPAFGDTFREIEEQGYAIDEKVPMLLAGDSGLDTALSVGVGVMGLASALNRLAPDLVVCMGDRFELLALGAVCTTLSLPMGHISGGEVTEGAMDDGIRHAMTKLSHLHFVANTDFAARLGRMGEEDWRVLVCGEPGLDYFVNAKLLGRAELEAFLGLDLGKPTALVTFHPVTRELSGLDHQMTELVAALEGADLQYVITFPNADPGHDLVRRRWVELAARRPERVRFFQSLGRLRYASLLAQASLMIGNSSSGLVEAPSFNLPVVNIGTRQQGRPQAANVFQTEHDRGAILAGIQRALAYDLPAVVNPFGDGHACPAIKDFILRALTERTREELLRKRFVDR